MGNLENVLIVPEISSGLLYGFFALMALIALYLVLKSGVKHKIELFILSFFLLTGNLNEKLTFALPGVSFFEIQPERLIFLVFSFFILRKILFSRTKDTSGANWVWPWFMVFLYLYVFFIILSQLYHVNDIGIQPLILNTVYSLNILVVIYTLKLIATREVIKLIGTAVIIGAVVSSGVGLIQFGVDSLFMRTGDTRLAFGSTIRSNGTFVNEYYNAYFLITAISWILISYKNSLLKILLIILLSAGVICAFQRMSWLILFLILAIYIIWIEKISLIKLLTIGLSGLSFLLIIFLLFYGEIMNSSLVRERLSEPIDSRQGYYETALKNIGKKPFFGFGGKDNDVYYYAMLKITHDRDRAKGITGDFHSGYFSTLFYYGIPATLSFIGFVIFAVIFFGRMIKNHLFFAIPFLLAMLFLVGNLTNTLLFAEYFALIYAIHLGLALGVRNMNDYLPETSVQRKKELQHPLTV